MQEKLLQKCHKIPRKIQESVEYFPNSQKGQSRTCFHGDQTHQETTGKQEVSDTLIAFFFVESGEKMVRIPRFPEFL